MKTICDNISLKSSKNEKCFRRNLYRKSKHMLFSIIFLSENRAFYELMWKN